MHRLLIVDDEKPTREGLRAALEDDFDVYVAEDAESALRLLEEETFHVLLTDYRLPKEDGIRLIRRAKSLSRPPVCLLMTAYGSEDVAAEAIRQGADDYISKGKLQIELLQNRISRLLKSNALEDENQKLKKQLNHKYGLENILGESKPMQQIFEIVRQVAPTRATVLIQGENGTGKEMIARAIHNLSPRAPNPLVTVHCAALTATLLESELFGHEKGAFTGAHERRIGRFEEAHGGTLFLDEIGEIDPVTQVKLLRFLGERTFERVGSNKTIKVDVRLIAATNRDLAEMVRQGTFREDLFFRMRVVEITLPTLRQRLEDVPIMAMAFLKEFAQENHRPIQGFSSEAMNALMTHNWPGNVRELRFAIERAVIMSHSQEIQPQDLPREIHQSSTGHPYPIHATLHPDGSDPEHHSPVSHTVQEAERQLIIRALQETGGNRTLAASKIGMSRRTLHRKLHKYNLENF
ncbi:MAG: sigma-54 dependent transcriptional regulator [Verrucomicrobia bacterium]|nr:sigma-54 dependent transcriptional regulator [Verrucomicrobiota bacterium]